MPPTSPATPEPTVEPAPLTPDEFRALVARVDRNSRRYWALDGPMCCLFHIMFTPGILLILTYGGIKAACGTIFLFLFLKSIQLYFKGRANVNQQEVGRLIRFVTNIQDVDMLGSLLTIKEEIRLATNDFSPLEYALNVSIGRMLPLIQASDAETLSIRHLEHLCNYVRYAKITFTNNADAGQALALSALKVLEQGGVKQTLPHLEFVLKSDAATDEIRAATESCVQVIRERIAREEGKDFLLRPERKPEAIATLLRPSQEQSNTPNEQLLRASTGEEQEA